MTTCRTICHWWNSPHVRYPTTTKMSDFQLTLLETIGIPAERFGDSEVNYFPGRATPFDSIRTR